MEPFKERIDVAAVTALADVVWGDWDRDGFLQADGEGWGAALAPLELKARVIRVADTLRAHLPDDWPTALSCVLDGLPAPPTTVDGVSDGFALWPLLTLVERHGLDDPDRSLGALERLTPHFSAEFAVRPYLAADPEGTLPVLERWAGDPNPHVRRLASEGSRPRLPWGARLAHRIADPLAIEPVLERLRDDPELYVRRSVANHVNDIAKDHPELVLELAGRWLQDASAERTSLVRHGLRTLLKAGDARAFALLGHGSSDVHASVRLLTPEIAVGDELIVEVELVSRGTSSARVKLDLAVHHRRKNGSLSPKVFGWTTRTLEPGERQLLVKRHAVREVTVRRLYPGEQAVDVRVDGVPTEALPWRLRAPRP